MNLKTLFIMVVGIMIAGCGSPGKETNASLTTFQDSVSYSIGADIGKNMNTQGIEINETALFDGWRAAFKGEDMQLTDNEIRATLTAFSKEMQEKNRQKAQVQAQENLQKGDAFLDENKRKEGVVTLISGLQYKIIEQGNGPTPTKDDKVSVHYKGTLINGEEFDSSYKRGKPASFAVTGVIKGWTEALQLMPVGSKWELYVPSNLAYGNGPRGPGGPNSTLIFEVELLGIE